MKETNLRIFLRIIGWRITGSTFTVLMAYLISGNFIISMEIGATELFFKIFLQFFYEKIWSYIKFGKKKNSDQMIRIFYSSSKIPTDLKND